MYMNIGAFLCAIMAIVFLIFALILAILKEKGAMIISGFNTLPKEQREKYDKHKISKDMRNMLFIWGLLYIIGGILSYILTQYIAIICFVIWIILFFREVHLDTEKAFSKYRIRE